jgi:hypothetical protein
MKAGRPVQAVAGDTNGPERLFIGIAYPVPAVFPLEEEIVFDLVFEEAIEVHECEV